MCERDPDDLADPDCPGCRGGDKVPAFEYWRCPVCDAEWLEEDLDPQLIED
jgi:hypothetical protein